MTLYHIMLYNLLLCFDVISCIVLHSVVSCRIETIMLSFLISYDTIFYHIMLFFSVLYYTVPCYTILYSIVLGWTMSNSSSPWSALGFGPGEPQKP